jgi:hypothetical protein
MVLQRVAEAVRSGLSVSEIERKLRISNRNVRLAKAQLYKSGALPTPDYVSGIPPALLQYPHLSGTAKLLGCCLLMHRNTESGLCYPTHDLLASEINASGRKVRRGLNELRDHLLVNWENREAPRGKAKGRASLYDLSGLDALRSIPIAKATELHERTKRTVPSQQRRVDSVRSRADKTDPSLRTNRVITENSQPVYLEADAASEAFELGPLAIETAPVYGGAEPREAGERTKSTLHSARITQSGSLKRKSARDLRGHLLAPTGTSFYDSAGEVEVWDLVPRVIEIAEGEPFNPGELSKLIDKHGASVVWFHAAWLLPRIKAAKTPVTKPTAFFVDSVRQDYDVEPTWQFDTRDLPDDVWKMLNGIGSSDIGEIEIELPF